MIYCADGFVIPADLATTHTLQPGQSVELGMDPTLVAGVLPPVATSQGDPRPGDRVRIHLP